MTYKTFRQVLSEANEYNDVDMYIAERGWQEWMDEYADDDGSGNNILRILATIYSLKDNPIKKLLSITGLSQQRFATVYGIPARSVENWSGQQRTAPQYVTAMLSYCVMSDLNII